MDDALSCAERGLLAISRISTEELRCARYVLHDQAAAEHLFAVVCGLDAMVLGESEIVAQAREAVDVAARAETLGLLLGRLFQRAFAASARARARTRIGHGAVSISSVAVELAEKRLGGLAGRSALIVGAGRMAGAAARGLRSRGVGGLVIANRTDAGARALAYAVRGRAMSLAAIDRELTAADVVVAATEAPRALLSAYTIAHACRARELPLLLLDLSVPRDVEEEAADLPNVELYDIDDLQQAAEENLGGRRSEALAATAIVRAEVRRFDEWREQLAVAPTLRALRLRAEAIRRMTLESAIDGGDPPTPAELERLDRLSRALVDKLLHTPSTRIRNAASSPAGPLQVEALRNLFALD
jgi:glutamyl-tRNA reductase